jgi:hypothetical protein
MTGIYHALETDKSAMEDGVWVEVYPGASFKLRSQRSKAVREVAMALARQRSRLAIATKGILPLDVIDRDNIEMCARAIVADMRGEALVDRDGKPIVYSEGAVRTLLTDLPELRDMILEASSMTETFRTVALADIVGNSSSGLSGRSDTAA